MALPLYYSFTRRKPLRRLQPGHGLRHVGRETIVRPQEITAPIGQPRIERRAHLLGIRVEGILYIVAMPRHGRAGINLPLLMKKAISGLNAVFCYHTSRVDGLQNYHILLDYPKGRLNFMPRKRLP